MALSRNVCKTVTTLVCVYTVRIDCASEEAVLRPCTGGRIFPLQPLLPSVPVDNSHTQSNFVRKTMAMEWVDRRLLRVLRSNDWYPDEIAPSGVIPLAPWVRVVVVERGLSWDGVSLFRFPLVEELVNAMSSYPSGWRILEIVRRFLPK